MGQPIDVSPPTVDGAVAAFHTDRSITGQDGVAFGTADDATEADSFPGELASRLFAADSAIDHVFIASNQVVARRRTEWDQGALDVASDVIAEFFVFYSDAAEDDQGS